MDLRMKRAAFLDRDGVINRDTGYVHRWEEFELIPGALDALRKLSELGFVIVVVTNQSGIGRGYYSVEAFHALMQRFRDVCAQLGIDLHYFYCPHAPTAAGDTCTCRKPRPGMLLQASSELGIDLTKSLMIGDRLSDMEAARAAGVPMRFLICGQPSAVCTSESLISASFDTLWECAASLPSGDPALPGV
jgi:D-glycero-D-manno-heptose 1,7-bisphosphate phosphatase